MFILLIAIIWTSFQMKDEKKKNWTTECNLPWMHGNDTHLWRSLLVWKSLKKLSKSTWDTYCICSIRPQIIQMHYAQFTDDGCITNDWHSKSSLWWWNSNRNGRVPRNYFIQIWKFEDFFFISFYTSVINCHAYRFMTFDGRIIFRQPRFSYSLTHRRRRRQRQRHLCVPLCFGDIVIR